MTMEEAKNIEVLFEIHSEAARYYQTYLQSKNAIEARQYLNGRQITEEAIRVFSLGASSSGWDDLYQYLRGKGYSDNDLLESELIGKAKSGNREEVVYNADGSVVTATYVANKLTSKKTVNADGTAVLEEYLENGSVRVTKYDKDGNVIEVTIDGVLVEEAKDNNLWIIIVIAAVAVAGVAALVIVLVKIKKRNVKEIAE